MRNRVPFGVFFTAAACISILAFGCGGGDGGEATTPASGGETPTAVAATGQMGTASISGTVSFNGTAPDRARLNLDRECKALHDGPVLSDETVVNDGKLQWAFVYVKEGISGTYNAPGETAVFDQVGCNYQPHVMGVVTGQDFKIRNSDPMLHNIHSLPTVNRGFNFGMPKQGDERDQSFRSGEVMVKVKCDVHPWMGAWIGVVDHPFFAVSGTDGSFSIDNLPAGDYTIELWHEKYGTQTMQVSVGDGEAATADFTVDGGSA